MRIASLFGCLLLSSLLATAADSPAPIVQGKLAAVQLLSVTRLAAKPAIPEAPPDGLTFHFLVLRPPNAGQPALKETRDCLVDGESYQAKTKAKLGKQFEPQTEVGDAEKFFERQPQLARLAPTERKAALAITVSIGGAELAAGKSIEVTLNVGFAKQVEPFTFTAVVPEK